MTMIIVIVEIISSDGISISGGGIAGVIIIMSTSIIMSAAMKRGWSRSRRASSPTMMHSLKRTAPGSQGARSSRSTS